MEHPGDGAAGWIDGFLIVLPPRRMLRAMCTLGGFFFLALLRSTDAQSIPAFCRSGRRGFRMFVRGRMVVKGAGWR